MNLSDGPGRADQFDTSGWKMFQQIVEDCPIAVFVTDTAGRHLFVNQQWCELTGLAPAQALGWGWEQAIHPADVRAVLRQWRHLITHGDGLWVRLRVVRPQGATATAVMHAVATAGRDGRRRFVGTLTRLGADPRPAPNPESHPHRHVTNPRHLANLQHLTDPVPWPSLLDQPEDVDYQQPKPPWPSPPPSQRSRDHARHEPHRGLPDFPDAPDSHHTYADQIHDQLYDGLDGFDGLDDRDDRDDRDELDDVTNDREDRSRSGPFTWPGPRFDVGGSDPVQPQMRYPTPDAAVPRARNRSAPTGDADSTRVTTGNAATAGGRNGTGLPPRPRRAGDRIIGNGAGPAHDQGTSSWSGNDRHAAVARHQRTTRPGPARHSPAARPVSEPGPRLSSTSHDSGCGCGCLFGELLRAESACHVREQWLAAFLDELPAAALLADADGRVEAVNQAFCDLFELAESTSDLVGTDCRLLVRPLPSLVDDPAGFATRLDELIRRRRPARREGVMFADGRVFERSHVPFVVRDDPAGEGYAGHLWIYVDVTARRILDAETEGLIAD